MRPFLQVGGDWQIIQTNGARVQIHVNQTNDQLEASASHDAGRVLSERAKGHVQGPNFNMTITWDDGTEGCYTGKLKTGVFHRPGEGILEGKTRDLKHPQSTADWHSDGHAPFRVV
jgi:hypothetical protein